MKMQVKFKNDSNTVNSFKGYARLFNGDFGNNKMSGCVSKSYLMRNLKTSSYATKYLVEQFPEGTNLAIEGCSQMEAYTWAILLHKNNANNQYKIRARDILPEVIEDAKTGVLNIGRMDKEDICEDFLVNNFYDFLATPIQKEAKEGFFECFERIPESWRRFNTFDPRYKKKVKRIANPQDDLILTTKRLEYIHNITRHKEGIDFVVKPKVFDNVLEFESGDVFEIDKSSPPESVGLVSFQNSLYHILDTQKQNIKYDEVDISMAQELFRKIKTALKPKGLFDIGTLSHDHLCCERTVGNSYVEIKQQGETIKSFCDSKIHKLLLNMGFEPIYFENYYGSKLFLPSLWRKK